MDTQNQKNKKCLPVHIFRQLALVVQHKQRWPKHPIINRFSTYFLFNSTVQLVNQIHGHFYSKCTVTCMIYRKMCTTINLLCNCSFFFFFILFSLCVAVAINDVTQLAMPTKSHAIYSNRMGTNRRVPMNALLYADMCEFNADWDVQMSKPNALC